MELMRGWSDVPIWAVLLTCTLVLLCADYIWTFSHFEKRGIPGPRPWPLVGNMVPCIRLGIRVADLQWNKQFGNVYGFYRGRTPILVVHDAKMLESIMVKDFSSFCDREGSRGINKPIDKGLLFLNGHEWREVRNLMSPAFSSGKLKQMFGLVNECGKQLGENFADCVEQGVNATVKELYGAFSMDVTASTAFGLNVDSQRDRDNVFIKHIKNILKIKMNVMRFAASFFPTLTGPLKRFVVGVWPNETIRFFEESIKRTVEQRRQEDEKRSDLLQLLMDAEAEDSVSNGATKTTPGIITANISTRVTKKRLTTDELVAQAFLLFVAGYDTTSLTLQYLSYNLALNPNCQERAYQEIQDIIGDADPTYESVSRLTYLEQCVHEALRLHTPGHSITRVAASDTKLGDYLIDKGSVVMLPLNGIHHNPEYYPDPEVFDPDRFAPETKDKRRPILFTPFGHGPRKCIASRLALLEAKVAMVHVLRKVLLQRCNETEVPLSYQPLPLGLMTKNPIKIAVQLR